MPLIGTTTLLLFPLLLTTVITEIRATSLGSELDNAVVGSPIVECEREFIHFSVPTKKPFRGRIYVKGEFSNNDCVRIYDWSDNENHESADVHRDKLTSGRHPARDQAASPTLDSQLANRIKSGGFGNYEQGNWRDFLRGSSEQSTNRRYTSGGLPTENKCPLVCSPCESDRYRRQTNANSAEIDVRLGTCNAQRDRTLNPPGLRVSAVLVVSFHQSFVTKVDRAYRVDCLYEESNKQVTTKIDVSMPQTVELSSEMEAPKCEYRIKTQGGIDLKNVRVGDQVVHEWRCQSASAQESNDESMIDIFGMLVHSCFVDDGQGKKQLVVDDHGCSTDNFIMPTPIYDTSQLKATITAPVVKFPDRDVVGFQCAISVFMRNTGNSPPKCDVLKNRTRRLAGYQAEDGWQLHAQQLTVLDPETSSEQREDLDKLLNEQLSSSSLDKHSTTIVEFCVSVAAFGFLIASSTFLLTITVGFALASLLLEKQAFNHLLRTN